MPLFIFLLGLDQCLKGPLSLFCSIQNSDFSHLYRLVCINTTGDPAEKFSFGAFPPEGAFGSVRKVAARFAFPLPKVGVTWG